MADPVQELVALLLNKCVESINISRYNENVTIHTSSYGSTALNGEFFSYLAKLYEVEFKNIETPGWEVVVNGCETCHHGRKEELEVTITSVCQQRTDYEITRTAEFLLTKLKEERQKEEDEEKRYQELIRQQYEEQKRQRKLAEKQEKLAKDFEILTFLKHEEEIFENLFNTYLEHQNLGKKEFALKIKNNHGDFVLFRMWDLANKSRALYSKFPSKTEFKQIFHQATREKETHKRRLAQIILGSLPQN